MSLLDVSLPDLELLVLEITRGELRCPVTSIGLASIGVPHLVKKLDALATLESSTAIRVLEVAIAERRTRAGRIELVWTGPEAKASEARDTAIVLQELFASAVVSVVVAGFRFDHGGDMLRSLHRAMKERSVVAWFFLDLEAEHLKSSTPGEAARASFLQRNWSFGPPYPRFFYDPRPLDGTYVSLHAKCVVVDDGRSLVTSANFTDRGQTRNIEVGVLVDDPTFSRGLAEQWRRAAMSVFREATAAP